MASKLALRQYISLPPHPAGDFDHGDVYLESGRVFVANTAAGTVELIDGEHLRHLTTIPGCPEAPTTSTVLRTVAVGQKPNGLAWDSRRKHLLVADVQENQARLIDPQAGEVMASVELPGRPRWAVYHRARDRFLVNIREPGSGSPSGALGRMGWTSIRMAAGRLWPAMEARWSRSIWPRVENRRGYRLRAHPTRSGTITSVTASTLLSHTLASSMRRRV